MVHTTTHVMYAQQLVIVTGAGQRARAHRAGQGEEG
jgi:hypothetical protein